MIDDAKIRLRILKSLPSLEPYRVEMEELDFGDRIGCSVRMADHTRRRFSTSSWQASHQSAPRVQKREGLIAYELTNQIAKALGLTRVRDDGGNSPTLAQ